MKNKGTIIEKKTDQRFETKDGSYAAVNPSSYKLGRIVNISLGGLVFKYTEEEEDLSQLPEDTIFLGNYGFSVGDLPFRTIDVEPAPDIEGFDIYDGDDEMELSETTPDAPLKRMEQSIEFTELTFKQIFAVDKFIRENVRDNELNLIQIMVE